MDQFEQSNQQRLLTVRFTGAALERETLPIYELGSTLIGIQRMIHKAYIEQAAFEGRTAALPRRVREQLALQIQDRRRGSDIYDFQTFLKLADASPTISALIAQILAAAGAYAAKEVIRYLRPAKRKARSRYSSDRADKAEEPTEIAEPVKKDFPLAISIYNDIRMITDRIGNIGGVRDIQLSSGRHKQLSSIVITRETRDYVTSISNATVLGESHELEGIVVKWDIRNRTADIQRLDGGRCKVFLNEKDFVNVRYKARQRDVITFYGRPMYKMGAEMRRFNRFRAERIVIPRDGK